MPDALVTKPFTAHLVLEGAERRLEVGEKIAAAELQHWGRSVDALVHTGRIALLNEVTAAEASAETLIAELERRAGELDDNLFGRLRALLPSNGREDGEDPADVAGAGAPAEGDPASGAEDDDQGGLAAEAPASTPPAGDPGQQSGDAAAEPAQAQSAADEPATPPSEDPISAS